MSQAKRLVKFNVNDTVRLPVFIQSARAGFGGDVYDDSHEFEDVPRCLVKNPDNTQVWQVAGDSMFPVLSHHDRILVERQNTAQDGDIVVAYYDGSILIKYYRVMPNGEVWLLSENTAFDPVFVSPYTPFAIVGIGVGFYRGLEMFYKPSKSF